jgi:hypothetical protein
MFALLAKSPANSQRIIASGIFQSKAVVPVLVWAGLNCMAGRRMGRPK